MKCKKRVISLLLCVIMIFATLVNPSVAEAADETGVYEEYTNVATTYRGDVKTYPEDKAGYVFAGWYAKNGDTYSPMSEAAADVATTAYAKFVKQEVLSMRFQLTEGTTAVARDTALRVITSVDSLDYSEVGFRIKLGEQETIKTSKIVYTTINGYTKDGVTSYYANEVFDASAKYFMTYSVTEITKDYFASAWTIIPMWTTLDGTTVDGVAKENLAIIDEVPDGVFETLTFEGKEDTHNITGNDQVASLERVTYAEANISADAATYGTYALKAEINNYWPVITVDLGKAYDTAVTLKFNAYLQLDAAYINDNYYPIDMGDVSPNYGQFNTWGSFTVTVPANTQYHSFRYNFEMGGRVSDVTKMSIYYDNFTVIEPPAAFEVLDFEKAKDMSNITGNDQVASLERVTYADANISADAAAYGTYALKAEINNYWPVITVDLGKAYDTAVTLKFDAYLQLDAAYINDNYYPIDMGDVSPNGGHFNTWGSFTVTVPANTQYHSFRYNFEMGGRVSDVTKMSIYFDNFTVIEPPAAFEVLDFEKAKDMSNITGNDQVASLERVTYADANISADAAAYGTYALKAEINNYWPVITVDLGKAYDTAVTLKFNAYLQLDAAYINDNYYPIDMGDVSPNWGHFNTWGSFTVTVPANTQYHSFRYNFEMGGRVSDVTKMSIYYDNFTVIEPQGAFDVLDFEKAKDMYYVSGNRTLSRQTTSGLTAVAGTDSYGDYVLKLEENSHLYPSLAIDFMKSYAEGVTISFDVFVEVDSTKVNNDRFIYEVSGSWARSDLKFNQWETVSCTLPAGASSASLMANFEMCGSLASDATTIVYIDNIQLH